MKPTVEQQRVIDFFQTGQDVAVEAGAGTGKTSTLVILGESTPKKGRYIAFNKAIVTEAESRMPPNVEARTAHSVAREAVGLPFVHRLDAGRMRPDALAENLRANKIVVPNLIDGGDKVIEARFLASLAMRALERFCLSAAEKPERRHVPYVEGVDPRDIDGRRTYVTNRQISTAVLPLLERAWEDAQNPRGTLPYSHDNYLKMWQLRAARIDADFVLFDEAQDASPVMLEAVRSLGVQTVYVGDTQQSIYGWRGAINALAEVKTDQRTFLTRSFRFGEEIARAANLVLAELQAPLRLQGSPNLPSCVELQPASIHPDAILTRTNGAAVAEMIDWQLRGRRVHLMANAPYIKGFLYGAQALQDGRRAGFSDLACFSNWREVQHYVQHDPLGSDLKFLTQLIDKRGVAELQHAMKTMAVSEAEADIVISTVHKAKGREWPVVVLGEDFSIKKGDDEELRLLYVAVTRAMRQVYIGKCDGMRRLWTGEPLEERKQRVPV